MGIHPIEEGILPNDNGVTIKAQEWGISGDIGVINGKEYTIISEEILFSLRINDILYTYVMGSVESFKKLNMKSKIRISMKKNI